jgi:hypothetical protein
MRRTFSVHLKRTRPKVRSQGLMSQDDSDSVLCSLEMSHFEICSSGTDAISLTINNLASGMGLLLYRPDASESDHHRRCARNRRPDYLCLQSSHVNRNRVSTRRVLSIHEWPTVGKRWRSSDARHRVRRTHPNSEILRTDSVGKKPPSGLSSALNVTAVQLV